MKKLPIPGLQFSDSDRKDSLDVPRKLLLHSSTKSLGQLNVLPVHVPKSNSKDMDSQLLLGSSQLGPQG